MSGRKVPVRHTPEEQGPGAKGDAPAFRDKPVSFVRRSGRMSEAQDRAWAELSPFYLLPVERATATTSVKPGTAVDPAAVYGRTPTSSPSRCSPRASPARCSTPTARA
ncbi:MAG: putative S-adenosylmethionine-dependent methyltransferase [Microbacterium sp.]|nr:putative S-adenosylmethionine-dependent methyltransferase [Microbacterium sp.]